MATLRYIANHHTGGLGNDKLAKTQHLTVEHIDNAHKTRWPHLKSEMGYWVGYNFVVLEDGTWVQTRALGEETAANRGHNRDTVSICTTGNFLIEKPTKAQIDTVRFLEVELILNPERFTYVPGTEFNFHISRIVPHRYLQPGTECNGLLPDDWGRKLAEPAIKERINVLTRILQALIAIVAQMTASKKLGRALSADDYSPCD